MNGLSRQARSDDTSGLKQAGLEYLHEDFTLEDRELLFFEKSTRGFNHPILAKYLCPHRLSSDLAADPDG